MTFPHVPGQWGAAHSPKATARRKANSLSPSVHLTSFLLFPGLPLLPPGLYTLLPTPCPPQPVSFPLSCLSWICPPSCLHAQFLPGLATFLPEAHRIQICLAMWPKFHIPPSPRLCPHSHSSSTTVLSSSCPRFRGVESISRQGGTTQAFIPEVANLGPTGQIQPLSILFGCTMLFESWISYIQNC